MSHIDSHEHELVGYFARLPVYHVLDTETEYDPDSDDPDFFIGYRQLVIGGGSGEHPGLIMVNPDLAVKAYVLAVNDEETRPSERKFTINSELEDAFREELRDTDELDMLVFAGWGTETHVNFYNKCKSEAMQYPYNEDDYMVSFVDWLMHGFGEFIYFAMPDLAPDTIALLKPFEPDYHDSTYNNIILPLPNALVYASHGTAFEYKRRNLKSLNKDGGS